jgi:hypothetical protein
MAPAASGKDRMIKNLFFLSRKSFHLTNIIAVGGILFMALRNVVFLVHESVRWPLQPVTRTLPDTTRTTTTTGIPSKKLFPEPPAFIDPKDLSSLDTYAAAWWMSRQRFNKVELTVVNLESASYDAIRNAGNGRDDVLMTADWLDYCVEHLSKWYKMIGTASGLALAENTYLTYVNRQRTTFAGSPPFTIIDSFMNTTIAVVPMGVSDHTSQPMQNVMVAALAATITSLLQHSVKRVVVVGHFKLDSKLTTKVFKLLSDDRVPFNNKRKEPIPFQDFYIGSSQLAFVHTTNVNSTFVVPNVPHGALKGLQEELRFEANPSHHTSPHPNNDTTGRFLGQTFKATDFEYVYFTEPDQILHARLASNFGRQMNDNRVIIPHRLNPFPHPEDLVNITLPEDMKSLPTNHSPAIYLDNSMEDDACCDYTDDYGKRTCENFWWLCDYMSPNGSFSYFEPFEFIKLSPQGTGIVTLAGSEHGRICRVKRHGRGTCTPSLPPSKLSGKMEE